MRYLPHTEEDVAEMLRVIGASSLEELFSTIPEDCRRKGDLSLPGPVTEWELNDLMAVLAKTMAVAPEYKVFLGAGSYHHFIPATVSYLLGRSEFSTSYTPYQPEISQGTLQAIFEYQTFIARLLGMDVANASLYDGASALAEALLMAARVSGFKKVALSSLIHPQYRLVVRTYLEPAGFEIVELPLTSCGRTELTGLKTIEGLAAVAVQSPNFAGCMEDLGSVASLAHDAGALLVASFTEPLAFGLYKSPGALGADICCGEGQSFGIPQSYGGPGLGMFASCKRYLRSMPGRLVGRTEDRDGKSGFVLTLATREQHIRREKATSNICTNSGLCAVTSAMYMASLGGSGLRELARLNYDKSEYLKKELRKAGFAIPFSVPTFNEFVVELPPGSDAVYQRLLDRKLVAGLPLASFYSGMENRYLLCVTETKTKNDMDELVNLLRADCNI
ncbi:MAG: aminomethyl-transferring glycine dehydrogenase subunit GcvPA [Syntrophobacteraceae bacterium]|nr:aminomethyl-transferring glycine dehydrogenase subunit GcvPA [Syntrophobacteraceae bacterium]